MVARGGQPPGAGRTLVSGSGYTTEYPFVVGVFDGDWWDGAQLYKAWALPNAQWVAAGPIANRTPSWILDLPL